MSDSSFGHEQTYRGFVASGSPEGPIVKFRGLHREDAGEAGFGGSRSQVFTTGQPKSTITLPDSDFSDTIYPSSTLFRRMAQISFALLQAHIDGVSIDEIAARLELTEEFVQERIEAARLCLVITRVGRHEIH